jgi:hypothetical protein
VLLSLSGRVYPYLRRSGAGVSSVRVIGRSRGTRSSGPGSITKGLAVLTSVCARGDLSRSPGCQELRVVEGYLSATTTFKVALVEKATAIGALEGGNHPPRVVGSTILDYSLRRPRSHNPYEHLRARPIASQDVAHCATS